MYRLYPVFTNMYNLRCHFMETVCIIAFLTEHGLACICSSIICIEISYA